MVSPYHRSYRCCKFRPLLNGVAEIALTLAVPVSLLPTSQPAFAYPQTVQLQKNVLDSLSSQERTALTQGQATVSGSNGQFVGRVLVNASASTAWDVLTDYDNFEQFFPHVENSRILESAGNQRVFEQVNVVRIFPLTSRNRIVVSATETYPRQIDFRLVEGDVDDLQGNWRIDPVSSNQMLITHQVFVDPKGGATVRDFVLGIYQRVLQETMGAIKTETERRAINP